ncbi:MAG: hypothetical protein BWZ02_02834 [Lentisphaerae bacterium ADurb.BinA184]|nr:MAG: hypothetical protein BWZ02_02834 [Lentisphaerae bacterium ADurb.BinA184]
MLDGVVEKPPHDGGVRRDIRRRRLQGAAQQPGQFDVVAVRGGVRGDGRGLARALGVPGAADGDGRDRREVGRELVPPAPADRINHAPDDEVGDFEQLAAVNLLPGGGVERGEGLQQVQVRVQPLAVAGAEPRRRDPPVRFQVLAVAPVARVRAVLLQQVERARGEVQPARVAGGQEVLREAVDGEALAVDDLAVVQARTVAPHLPEPAAVVRVPEMRDEEICAPFCEVRKLASPGEPPGQRREPPQQPALRVEILLRGPEVVALPVEVGEKAAALPVGGARQPERDDAVVEVIPDLGETLGDTGCGFRCHGRPSLSGGPRRRPCSEHSPLREGVKLTEVRPPIDYLPSLQPPPNLAQRREDH